MVVDFINVIENYLLKDTDNRILFDYIQFDFSPTFGIQIQVSTKSAEMYCPFFFISSYKKREKEKKDVTFRYVSCLIKKTISLTNHNSLD